MTPDELFKQVHAEIDQQRGRVEEPEPPEITRKREKQYVHNLRSYRARKVRKKLSGYCKNPPRPGEISQKEWVAREAEATGQHPTTIQNRLRGGGYPHVKERRVNARVIWVTP